jgi:hypothetical protein
MGILYGPRAAAREPPAAAPAAMAHSNLGLMSWCPLLKKSIRETWYGETYTPTSIKAETVECLEGWGGGERIYSCTKSQPHLLVRVIAPDSAPEAEIDELRSMGSRTFS